MTVKVWIKAHVTQTKSSCTCMRYSAMYSGLRHFTPCAAASDTSTLKSSGFSRLKSANRCVASLYKDGEGLGRTCGGFTDGHLQLLGTRWCSNHKERQYTSFPIPFFNDGHWYPPQVYCASFPRFTFSITLSFLRWRINHPSGKKQQRPHFPWRICYILWGRLPFSSYLNWLISTNKCGSTPQLNKSYDEK